MPTILLKEMQQDISEATMQLEMISQMLQSHAVFLRSKSLDHLTDDVLLVEGRVGALTESIRELKEAALKISKTV